ncbi:MAG: hypothetical protein AB9866_18925 [Syntrophobacteraceae bacterium]
MKWFKFYGQDWLTDIKIIRMSVEDRLCFITLLCLASTSGGILDDCDEDIIIKLTHLDDDPSDTDNEVSRAKGFFKRLNDNKMITNDNNGRVIITNFMKRQGANLSGYERVKRYRDNKKNASVEPKKKISHDNANDNINDNADDNARIDKIRIDNKEEPSSEGSVSKKKKLKEILKNPDLTTADNYETRPRLPKKKRVLVAGQKRWLAIANVGDRFVAKAQKKYNDPRLGYNYAKGSQVYKLMSVALSQLETEQELDALIDFYMNSKKCKDLGFSFETAFSKDTITKYLTQKPNDITLSGPRWR